MFHERKIASHLAPYKIIEAIVSLESVLPVVIRYSEINCNEVSATGEVICRDALSVLQRILIDLKKVN